MKIILHETKKHSYHWIIYVDGKRTGKVFIELPDSNHPAIQIFLNKTSQDKGIGRVAYRKACEKSKLNKVYAYMRKSNLASKKAAMHAGFKEIKSSEEKQLTLVWKKK